MIVIGLTGGIASGKSTVAAMLRAHDVPVHDADATVHELLGVNGEAVVDIVGIFGNEIRLDTGAVDRVALGSIVFSDKEKRQQLEQILHPLVAASRDHFIETHRDAGTPYVVLDVPLLFETGTHSLCDYVIVVHASHEAQYERALARPKMTSAKLDDILATQMPMAEKVAKADFVLETDTSMDDTRQMLAQWMETDLKNLLDRDVCGDGQNA